MIRERLSRLRELMAAKGIDAYIIPTSDFHGSEYIGEYFKVLRFFSGFSGSAGTLVITADKAGLWTDARYFLRAEQCLAGTGIELFRMGEPQTPSVDEFLNRSLPEYATISVDGRMLSAEYGRRLERALGEKRRLSFDDELVTPLWQDRPALPQTPVYLLEEKYSGLGAAQKLKELRDEMRAMQVEAHLISSLDQIAWLLNIRGGDVKNNPLTLAYLLIEAERLILFTDDAKLSEQVRGYLENLGCEIRPYEKIYASPDICAGKRLLVDTKRTNYALCRLLREYAELVEQPSPVLYAKAVKNAAECENLRRAHIKDGLIVTRFIYRLKTGGFGQHITEMQLAEQLDKMRLEQPDCVSLSFGTIAAYGQHGADIHYSVTPESNVELEPKGFLLVDSGGQYFEGTTDITRTIALGALTQEEKKHFTLVLQAMLNLSLAVFPQGCCGFHLDALAREPLWAQGLDFAHGTGHGIGYMLCVHEPPVGFRWQRTERDDSAELHAGNVISDEPGIYIPGSHGIRLENELLCREWEKPGFLCFETLTLAPIDLDAIDGAWLDERGRLALNEYHKKVYQTLSPYLSDAERAWLAHATREI